MRLSAYKRSSPSLSFSLSLVSLFLFLLLNSLLPLSTPSTYILYHPTQAIFLYILSPVYTAMILKQACFLLFALLHFLPAWYTDSQPEANEQQT